MKRIKKIFLPIMFMMVVFALVACSTKEVTITFDARGGNPVPTEQVILKGEKATEPPEPERDGYDFTGWYLEGAKFNFNTTSVTKNITLTARWSEKISEIRLVAPSVATYYLGSRPFDPLADVYAYDVNTLEEMEVRAIDYDEDMTAMKGVDSYTVEVVGHPEERRTIKLTVKELSQAIPEELKKTPINIEFWHANGSTIDTAIKRYATEFETMMSDLGYDITVSVLKPAGGAYDDLRVATINAMKGGQLPHLVQNYPDHVVEYNANGFISSLTPYIFHPTYGMNPEVEHEDFYDILEVYRNENKSNNIIGDYLSLPFNKSSEVAVYNKTIFDKVLGRRPFPETWQDLFELTDEILAIKDREIDLLAETRALAGKPMKPAEIQEAKDQFVPFTYDNAENAFITFTRQFGGSYTSVDQVTGKGRLEFINDHTRRMLEFFGEDRGRTFTFPQYWGVDYANNVWFTGQTIFSVGSTAGLRFNNPIESGYELFELGIAPIPYDKHNPSSRQVIQQGTNISLTTRGDAHEKLAAWLFLKYLTSRDVQADFGVITGYMPVRNSSYSVPSFMEYLDTANIELPSNYNDAGMSASNYSAAFEAKYKAMGSLIAASQRNIWFYDQAFVGSSKAREEVGMAFERIVLYKGTDLLAEIEAALTAAKENTEIIIN